MAEFEDEVGRLGTLYIGTVAANDDPEGLGRVRVLVPGVIGPDPSGWMLPLGTIGGGAKQGGFYAVPPVGADVGILFKMGDPDHGYYLAASWGRGEAATFWDGVDKKDVPKVAGWEFGPFVLYADARPGGTPSLYIKEHSKGKFIRLGADVIEIGGSSSEAAVLGNALKSLLTQALDQIKVLTVPTPMGPSGVPLNAAAFEAIKQQLDVMLSKIVKVK